MSSSLGIIVGVARHAVEAIPAIEAAVRTVLGDDLCEYATFDVSADLLVAYIAQSPPIASAWAWFDGDLRPALRGAIAAIDPGAMVLAEAFDPDDQSPYDVMPWELI